MKFQNLVKCKFSFLSGSWKPYGPINRVYKLAKSNCAVSLVWIWFFCDLSGPLSLQYLTSFFDFPLNCFHFLICYLNFFDSSKRTLSQNCLWHQCFEAISSFAKLTASVLANSSMKFVFQWLIFFGYIVEVLHYFNGVF